MRNFELKSFIIFIQVQMGKHHPDLIISQRKRSIHLFFKKKTIWNLNSWYNSSHYCIVEREMIKLRMQKCKQSFLVCLNHRRSNFEDLLFILVQSWKKNLSNVLMISCNYFCWTALSNILMISTIMLLKKFIWNLIIIKIRPFCRN